MPFPAINPVDGAQRPRWSVMVPAWNAADFVGRTLESVLAADLPEDTQVEVVDDLSTDSTAAEAGRFSERGVAYHRHDRQHGASANFNACIRRARGELIHILHADDEIEPGFYRSLESAMAHSDIVAAFCRCAYVDHSGRRLKVTRAEGRTGVWTEAIPTLAVSNRIRPPAIVVRRSAYEAVGGFREDLSHAADWEMWMRLARHGPIWHEDQVLARYRVHEEQDTAAKVQTGENIRERVAALALVNQGLSPSHLRKGLLYSAVFAGRTALDLARGGEWSAAGAQLVAGVRCGAAGLVGSVSIAAPR